MELAAPLDEDRVVGGLLGEGMSERVLGFGMPGDFSNQIGSLQLDELRFEASAQLRNDGENSLEK